MSQPSVRIRLNLPSMLVAVVGFALVAACGTITLAAQDPLWFSTGFDERPFRITIYQAGQRTQLQTGQAGFDELAEAVRASLAQGVARPSGIGLSAGSLEDAYNQYTTLEVFFSRPVKLHAWFNTGQPTQMLFPITGRHSQIPVVFLGDQSQYWSNAPVLKTIQPIRMTLNARGVPTD